MPDFMKKMGSMLNLKKSHPQLNKSSRQAKVDTKPNTAKDDALLAFRTITTMLSLIQSPKVNNTEREVIPHKQRRDLRVLDALSALIVREHEIVAVMANYNGAEVIASVSNMDIIHQHSESEMEKYSEGESKSQTRNRTWNPFQYFTITPNPRNPDAKVAAWDDVDSLTTRNEGMTVVNPYPKIAEHYQPSMKGEDLLDLFLQSRWWVFW
jgi:hypothetical protein